MAPAAPSPLQPDAPFLLDRRKAPKRPLVPLDLEGHDHPAPGPTPEEEFDRAWARQLMGEIVERFRSECRSRRLDHYLALFEWHVLESSGPAPRLRDSAGRLGIDEKDAANYLYRARRLFAELTRRAVRETVNGTEQDVRAELEHLRRNA